MSLAQAEADRFVLPTTQGVSDVNLIGDVMKRAIITVGLGFGDEGKGATVDFLPRRLEADLVVRYCGGSQAGHNVELPDGLRHTFAQFGAGTLALDSDPPPPYLGANVIIE